MIKDYLALATALIGFIVTLVVVLVMTLNVAQAHDQVINIDNSTNYYGGGGNGNGLADIESSINGDVSRAVATAASMAFCHFDYGPGLQGCAGTATYDDEWAVTFQVGQRVDTLLLTGGVACDDEFSECAAGGGVMFRF